MPAICFCARKTALAAEAGLATAPDFRGRGLGTRVTAAWAVAIRDSGLLPIYSTSWENTASLSVAQKLGLTEPDRFDALGKRLNAMLREGQLLQNRAGAYVPEWSRGQELIQYLAQLEGLEYAVVDRDGTVTGLLKSSGGGVMA